MPDAVESTSPPAVRVTYAAELIGSRRWVVSVRDGVALMMLSGVVSAVMAYFPVGVYYHRAPASQVVAVLHMGLALLPIVAGATGAWVITRSTGSARDPSTRWLRLAIRLAAVGGFAVSCAFAVAPGLWASFGYDAVHRATTAMLVLANGLIYLHLAVLTHRMRRRLLAVPCTLLAVLLPALLAWADLWRLAIGLETYGPLMLLTAVPVIGSGLPQTARYAGVLVGGTGAPTAAPAAQILLLYAIAILAMLALLEMRRAFRAPSGGAIPR